MSRSTSLFAGLLGTFALSAYVMVLVPQAQLGALQPAIVEDDGKITDIYPIQNAAADQGRQIYVREGCVYCHSQQVRDEQNGTDLSRGWGNRRSVARDYLFDEPALLGSFRLGPDLANVGSPDWRNEPKGDTQRPLKRDATWHYLHLYAPRTIVRDSNHPPYPYLFDEIKISGQRSVDALDLEPGVVRDGYEIVPTNAAKSLVTYLRTLDRSHPLKEAGAPAAAAAPAATAGSPAK